MNQCRHFNNMVKYMANPNAGLLLPKTYQQVDYLYNDGNQYINTGISGADGIEIDFLMIGSGHIAYSTSNDADFGIEKFGDGWVIRFGGVQYATNRSGLTTTNIKFGTNTNYDIYINNELESHVENPVIADAYVYLFTKDCSGGVEAQINYVKLYKEGVLVSDIIPCIRKSDSKPGMYDLINRRFLTNIGTGEFVAVTE